MKLCNFILFLFFISVFSFSDNYGQFNKAGLKVWLRADALSSMSDGAGVAEWTDMSGSGNHAVQASSASQPVYRQSAVANYPAVYFNGMPSFLSLPSPADIGIKESDYEIFIVAQYSAPFNQYLIASESTNGPSYALSVINDASGGGNSWLTYKPVPHSDYTITPGVNYADNTPHIFSVRTSSASGAVRVDKADRTTWEGNYQNSENCPVMTIGCRPGGLYHFKGYIAEILIFNTVLSSSERDRVEKYLSDKYDGTDYNYYVTSTGDANTGAGYEGTLRYVLNMINTGAKSIESVVDMTNISGTITLTSDLPAINYKTIIKGPGESSLTINGSDLYRPFFIGSALAPFSPGSPASPAVSISDLTIAHGLGKGGDGGPNAGGGAGMGGAIFLNSGSLLIDHVAFSDNRAAGGNTVHTPGAVGGGGGFAGSGSTKASGIPASGGSSGYLGGAAGSEGSNADGGAGGSGAGGGGAEGSSSGPIKAGNGGFAAGGGSAATSASNPLLGGSGGFGGGGGIPYGSGGFGGGHAGSSLAGGGAAMGGAVFNRNGSLTIQNASFIRNTAAGGTGGNNGLSYGGAVFNYTGTLSQSSVTYGSGADANSAGNEADVFLYHNFSDPAATFSQAGLRLWLRADAMAPGHGDGDKVFKWTDLSQNGRDAFQPYSADYQPVYRTSGIFGKPSMQFSGSQSYMLLNSPASLGIKNQEYEVFIVAQSASPSGQFLLSAATNAYELQVNPGGSYGCTFSPVGSQYSNIGTPGIYTDGQPHVFSARVSSSGSIVRVDKMDGTSNHASGLNDGDYSQILLGGRANGTAWFNGSIAEVLIFNTVLSASERTLVERYLYSRYRNYFLVTGTGDDNSGTGRQGTLRYVLNMINSLAPSTESTVDMTALSGTITLSSQLPPVNYNTTIIGPGQGSLTISGNDLYRPFFIGAGTAPFTPGNPASPVVSISKLTIAHGRGKGGNGAGNGGGAAGMGGAVFINKGNVTIEDVTFVSNTALGGDGADTGLDYGGGGGGFGGDAVAGVGGSGGYLGGTGGTNGIGQGSPGYAGSGGIGAGGGGSQYRSGGNGGFAGGGGSPNAGLQVPGNGGFGGGGASGAGSQGSGGFGAGDGGSSWNRGGGGGGFGGAVFNHLGNLTLVNSAFNNNTASGGLGHNSGAGFGGAIFNYGGSIATINLTYGSGASANSAAYQNNLYYYGGSQKLPEISLLPSSGVSETGATLNITINPGGFETTYHFAWGTDPNALSNLTPESSAGSGTSPLPLSHGLTGLTPGTVYYFQVTASSTLGTAVSKTGSIYYDTSVPHTNLKLWLDAGRGVLTETGNAVSTWADLSNNCNSALQNNATYRAVLTPAAINGHEALGFDGTNDFLTLPKASELGIRNSDYEIFAVVQSASSGTQFIISGSAGNYEMYLNGASGLAYIANPSSEINTGSAGEFSDALPHCFSVRPGSGGITIRADGIDGSSFPGQNGQSSDDSPLRIGTRSSGASPLNGYVAEILIYNAVLDEAARNSVETYLANKYHVTGGRYGGPTAEISYVSNLTAASATLKGTVNPNGQAADFYFRYGTSSSALTETTPVQSAGSGNSAAAVSADIAGLVSGTKYYYQLVASSAAGSRSSAVQSFFYWPSIPQSGLRVWLDACRGISTAAPGGAVAQWNDCSGNGNNAAQAAASLRPLFYPNVIDGNPVVRFSSSRHLHLPALDAIGIANSDYEIFVVAKSTSSSRQLIISGAPGWGPEIQLNGWGYGASLISNNKDQCNQAASGKYSDAGFHLFSIRAAAAYGMLRIDGEDGALSAMDYRAPNSGEFHIGIRTSDFPLEGDIAEIIIYSSVLSSEDRAAVELYLDKKYILSSGAMGGPAAQIAPSADITSSSATLKATVSPNGQATTFFFSYGTSPDNLNNTTAPQSAGSGFSPVTVSTGISGLSAAGRYYYRVSATSALGTKTSLVSCFMESPVTSANLRLWLDAGCWTSTTTSGSGLSQWNDLSGNRFDAQQAAGSLQPAYQAGAVNGNPAIRFNGANGHYIVLPSASLLGIQNSSYEIFIVARSSSPACQFLMGGTVPEYEMILNTGSGGFHYIADGVLGGSDQKEMYAGSAGTCTDNQPHLFNVSIAPDGGKVFIDGVLMASTASDFRNPDPGVLRLGRRSDGSGPLYGDIAEVIIYNAALGQPARSAVQSYLSGKYNITSGALPVELTAFAASAGKQGTLLKWSTASEVSNYGFDVERRGDEQSGRQASWEKIGFVMGSGNSNSPREYEFVDRHPLNGKNIYRLKQTDNDGRYEYSPISEVLFNSIPDDFSLLNNYPNPANPSTTIKYGLPVRSMVIIAVYNSLGEKVTELVNEARDEGFHEIKWNASDVSSGIYFYSIKAKEEGGSKEFSTVRKMLILK